MRPITASVRVNRPREDVFSFLDVLANHVQFPPPPRLRGHAYRRGSLAAAAGVVCLTYGGYGWAAFFLILGALSLAGGYWYIRFARLRP